MMAQFHLPWFNGLQAHDPRGFMVAHLAEAHELMALARAGKIMPTPMKKSRWRGSRRWIDELRAGKVVGRFVLKTEAQLSQASPKRGKGHAPRNGGCNGLFRLLDERRTLGALAALAFAFAATTRSRQSNMSGVFDT